MDDPTHKWELRETDGLSDGTLSPCIDVCIKELRGSGYADLQESEIFCRTITDLIFLDRLHALKDKNATSHLKLAPEVSLSVERGSSTITGRADWCLGYGNVKGGFESALIILHNINSSVFGLVTDSSFFQFFYLDPARKLFTSRPFLWVFDKKSIIQWIDRVLKDSIEASPHTTPVKFSNQTLRAYQTELKRGHLFGDPSNDNPDLIDGEDERPVNVVWREGSLMVVECDETEDTDDAESMEE
ncbi:hypothetical protein TEQG_03822 [Trichophyton equinum CBS 127.97]|uniref:Uncharacterized protein n=1 Tax=Trichophyton equinum (strain ATCC MYA-4606 / CBS 127.97) TaxID=559882 RepID=F2PSW0_TRIEC|nr:hypothetical protein TEQG_03822 [Trichophyton equinum CBS 127.97]